MAKHKKKKSPPTPDPEDSTKKENMEENKPDIPPTESEEPPKEPVQTEQEQSEKKRKLDKLFWFRITLAIIAGTTATFIFDSIEGEERRWASIGFMIIIFIVSIIIAKGMKIPFAKSDRKKIVTQGLGSYIFLYLFIWILTYTFVNAPDDTGIGTGIPGL